MTAKPTRLAATLLALTASHIKPVLAKDAKIDLMPIFKDVTRKNFKAKTITMALDAALKGKLAKDANIKHVTDMLDALEPEVKEEAKDESVSDPQQKAMEAAAAGNSNLGIPQKVGLEFSKADEDKGFDAEPFKAFLKGKGVSDEDIETAMDMASGLPKNALDEETAEEKEKREAAEKEAAKMEAAKDAEIKNMVSKGAMDAALQAHGKAVEQRVIERQKAVRDAERTVKPWVGELANSMGFDSAGQVYRAALDVLGIDTKKVTDDAALPVILNLAPKPGARPTQHNALALDSAAAGGFAERHPEAARINSI